MTTGQSQRFEVRPCTKMGRASWRVWDIWEGKWVGPSHTKRRPALESLPAVAKANSSTIGS